MVHILIVDDQILFAEGLKTILESRSEDLVVIGIAENGSKALDFVRHEKPDIILMDVRMPVMDGVEATKVIHDLYPEVKIVMLTTFDDDEYVRYSLAHGAIGYLLKNRPPAELIASIHAVMGGILQIDPAVSKTLISNEGNNARRRDETLKKLRSLTKREKDVLTLLVDARDNRYIADHLNVAEQTIRNYTSTIYSKLGISNRVEIMKLMDMIDFFLTHPSDE